MSAGVAICLEQGADCHCHPKTPSSPATFKSRLVLSFYYQFNGLSWKRGRWTCVVVVEVDEGIWQCFGACVDAVVKEHGRLAVISAHSSPTKLQQQQQPTVTTATTASPAAPTQQQHLGMQR